MDKNVEAVPQRLTPVIGTIGENDKPSPVPTKAEQAPMSNDAMRDAVQALFQPWPKDEMGPSDEPESQYRLGYNTAVEDVLDALAAQADARVEPVVVQWQVQTSSGGWSDIDADEKPSYRGPFRALGVITDAPTAPAQSEAKPAAWIARWHGSNPERGWSIYAGRDCVAYLGGDESMSEAIGKIVADHNKCFDCDGGPCVMNCSGLTSSEAGCAEDDVTALRRMASVAPAAEAETLVRAANALAASPAPVKPAESGGDAVARWSFVADRWVASDFRDAEDAARFRWITEDHDDRATREKCREILSRMCVMSYSATCQAIDAAILAKRGGA